MASYKEHCADCKEALGKDWSVVHRWLDECYKLMPGNLLHRGFRHHTEGVEKVRAMWGDDAALAAEIHIKRDFPGLEGVPTVEDWKDERRMIENSNVFLEIVECKKKKNNPKT